MTMDHSTTRTRSGAVEGVDASVPTSTAVATYPLVKTSAATGTVQSRSPSAIRSASGPWPEIESPRRYAVRQVAHAQASVMPSGMTVTSTPSTWTPEPCAISQASAPDRSASRGAPCVPASVRNQPATPTARQTVRVPAAARTPASAGHQHQWPPVPEVVAHLGGGTRAPSTGLAVGKQCSHVFRGPRGSVASREAPLLSLSWGEMARPWSPGRVVAAALPRRRLGTLGRFLTFP